MFYLSYLRSELYRRKGRTILTVLGLALGVALVIVISSLSQGLNQAQKTALNPLSSLGTDLTVTAETNRGDNIFASRELQTDLSKLGKAGQHFSYDTFSAGTQPTFAQSQAKDVAAITGVARVSTGLTLTVTHQEGTIPKITAQFQTGGERINVQGQTHRPTAQEMAAIAKCLAKEEAKTAKTATSKSTTSPRQSAPSGSLTGKRQNGPGQFGGSDAMRKCMPASMRRFRKTVTTKKRTLTKQVNTPKTDIKTSTYTIGGVDVRQTDMGLITKAQITKGVFLSQKGTREALAASSYASGHKLKIGSSITIKKVKFRVIGFVQAPLGGQSADVYIPLKQLQSLSGQKNQINVVLVRADKSSNVSAVQKKIKLALPSASIASNKSEAEQISGSLVDASNLSKSLGLALAAIVIAMATALAALLTLSSIQKRVREIGTLRAIGWKRRLVIRQIVGESLTQGLLGGLLGIVLGVVATICINAFGPTLSAQTTSTVAAHPNGPSFAGQAAQTVATQSSQIALKAPLAISIIALGAALALLAGLIAGGIGAFRAARLRPADALRQVE